MPELRHAPVRIGSVGLGGYAWAIAEVLAAHRHVADFPSVCEIDAGRREEKAATLAGWNVAVLDSFDQLLEQPIDAVWLPIPISLHQPFTERALAAGKAVLCEKPAAGTVQEVDAMIAARDRAGLPVYIAYQHLADPAILQVKRRLLQGDLGELRSVRTMGCWPRPTAYFHRNDWAGRLRVGQTWVLDSPLSNAMSHYLQMAMFIAGPELAQSAQASSIEAELYRANAIENFDTCSLRITLQKGLPLLVHFTHACATSVDPRIELFGSRGRLVIVPERRIEWHSPRGLETIPLLKDPRGMLLESFCKIVRGDAPATAIAALEIARAPVVVVNAVAEGSVPRSVPADTRLDGDRELVVIRDIESIFSACNERGQMLHESGLASWSVPPSSTRTVDYRRFDRPKDA